MLSRAELLRGLEDGHRLPTDPPVLFYGGPLSQWAASPFILGGVRYPTAEHWMMDQKAFTFRDQRAREAIRATEDPGTAKSIGRQVQGYIDETWAQIRVSLVLMGNLAKFQQNPVYRDYLLGTGHGLIVEASGTDRIWGVGLWETDPAAADPLQWRGENLLGFVLMEVRDWLRAEREMAERETRP